MTNDDSSDESSPISVEYGLSPVVVTGFFVTDDGQFLTVFIDKLLGLFIDGDDPLKQISSPHQKSLH